MSASKVAAKHCKMRFVFTGMKAALKFRDELRRLGHTGELELRPGGSAWDVVTDSRCLLDAMGLYKLIYGGAQ